MYFMISNSDGDTYIEPLTEAKLLQELENRAIRFITLEDLKSEVDPNYWGENVALIIKGDVIIPKPKEIIMSYEV